MGDEKETLSIPVNPELRVIVTLRRLDDLVEAYSRLRRKVSTREEVVELLQTVETIAKCSCHAVTNCREALAQMVKEAADDAVEDRV